MGKIIFRTAFREYKSVRQLGQGGSGRVFEVRGDDGILYALKVLDAAGITAERKARFRNEIAFCQQAVHPGIIRVLDVGYIEEGGVAIPFYVMPLYSKTLRSLMREGVDSRRAVNLFMQLLTAMSIAHARGVSHRDIKPENVLVDDAGNAVLADFGIARFSEIDAATLVATREGTRLANFMYAAPEQRLVDKEVTQKADVYALGLVGHELLTGQIPLGEGAKTVLDVAPQFSFMDPLLQRMRRQDPEDRPPLLEVIEMIRAEMPAEDSAPSVEVEASGKPLGELESIAARVSARHEHEARKKRFLNSDDGVVRVRASFDNIRSRIEDRVGALREVLAFGIRAEMVSGQFLEIKAAGFSGVPMLRIQYANSLDGAKARFTVWKGDAHLPGRMFFDEPEEVLDVDFLPSVDESDAVVWKTGSNVFSESDLADHMLALLLQAVEKSL